MRPILMMGEPQGALDSIFIEPKQSPLVDGSDSLALEMDRRQQQIIENDSRVEAMKKDKLGGIGRMLTAMNMGYHGQDPSAAFAGFNNRVAALQEQNARLNSEMGDISLKRAMLEQRAASPGSAPAAVQEYQFWNSLPEGAQKDFERLKRDPTALEQWKVDNAEILRNIAALQKGAETDAADWSKTRQGILKQGLEAQGMIPKIEEMLELNARIKTGATAAMWKRATDLFNTTVGDVGKFHSLAGEMVLGQIRQLGANPTEGERAFLEGISSSLSQGGQVNEAILSNLKQVQERMLDRAKWFAEDRSRTMEEWLLRNGDFEPGDIQRDGPEAQADTDLNGFKIISVE
ncbi:hypothetical protein [Microbulbifer epialgicus]|uniref:Uncharacterized protein n=1 Tax=Microbulbifer epialgicus TaxID=393907 RepID=A0ABV4P5S9_9GAMM